MANNEQTFRVKITDDGTIRVVERDLQRLREAGADLENTTGNLGNRTRQTNKALERMSQATTNASRDFAKLSQGMNPLVKVYATFAANIWAAEAAMTALQRAENRLVQKAGMKAYTQVTGQDLTFMTQQVKAATGSLMTFEEAAKHAAIAAAAGFGGEDLKALSKVAVGASKVLGRDLSESMDRLVRGVVKAEAELLDELGIILRLRDATEEYALAVNKNVTELTTWERQQAVLNNVVAQGEAKFGAVSELLQEMESPINKLGKTLKEDFLGVMEDIAKVLQPLAESIQEITESFIMLSVAILTKMGASIAKSGISNSFTRMNIGLSVGTKNLEKWAKSLDKVSHVSSNIEDFEPGMPTERSKNIRARRILFENLRDIRPNVEEGSKLARSIDEVMAQGMRRYDPEKFIRQTRRTYGRALTQAVEQTDLDLALTGVFTGIGGEDPRNRVPDVAGAANVFAGNRSALVGGPTQRAMERSADSFRGLTAVIHDFRLGATEATTYTTSGFENVQDAIRASGDATSDVIPKMQKLGRAAVRTGRIIMSAFNWAIIIWGVIEAWNVLTGLMEDDVVKKQTRESKELEKAQDQRKASLERLIEAEKKNNEILRTGIDSYSEYAQSVKMSANVQRGVLDVVKGISGDAKRILEDPSKFAAVDMTTFREQMFPDEVIEYARDNFERKYVHELGIIQQNVQKIINSAKPKDQVKGQGVLVQVAGEEQPRKIAIKDWERLQKLLHQSVSVVAEASEPVFLKEESLRRLKDWTKDMSIITPQLSTIDKAFEALKASSEEFLGGKGGAEGFASSEENWLKFHKHANLARELVDSLGKVYKGFTAKISRGPNLSETVGFGDLTSDIASFQRKYSTSLDLLAAGMKEQDVISLLPRDQRDKFKEELKEYRKNLGDVEKVTKAFYEKMAELAIRSNLRRVSGLEKGLGGLGLAGVVSEEFNSGVHQAKLDRDILTELYGNDPNSAIVKRANEAVETAKVEADIAKDKVKTEKANLLIQEQLNSLSLTQEERDEKEKQLLTNKHALNRSIFDTLVEEYNLNEKDRQAAIKYMEAREKAEKANLDLKKLQRDVNDAYTQRLYDQAIAEEKITRAILKRQAALAFDKSADRRGTQGVERRNLELSFLEREIRLEKRLNEQKLRNLKDQESATQVKLDEFAAGNIKLTPAEELAYNQELLDIRLRISETESEIAVNAAEAGEKIREATKFTGVNELESALKGVREGFRDLSNDAKSFGEISYEATQTLARGMGDALVDSIIRGEKSFEEAAKAIIANILEMIAKQLIFNAISMGMGGLFAPTVPTPHTFTKTTATGMQGQSILGTSTQPSFADGGIMTSDGPVPLRKYSRGGIANSPQAAIFGEGSTPEAYVPLPDGKAIPVNMQGSSSPVVNVNITMVEGEATEEGETVSGGGSNLDKEEMSQLGSMIGNRVKHELAIQQRPGGMLWRGNNT